MELYVKMTDEEYQRYRQQGQAPLEKLPPETLAAALLTAIKKSDGSVCDGINMTTNMPQTRASITTGKYQIDLTIAQWTQRFS